MKIELAKDQASALPVAADLTRMIGWIRSLRSIRDPRIPFALILTLYAVLGCTVLTFSRDPAQIILTVLSACLLDMGLGYALRGRIVAPLSAYITGLSLALLLNYSHNYYLLFVPVYFAIGSKYVFTHDGRHVFNPSMFGVALSLLLGGDLITTAPAYQWGGTWAISAFMITLALSLFVLNIGRNTLIISFLAFYIVQISLRAYIMRYYLPPEALLLGTLTSAPFYLFVFYMITDPQTSPATKKGQIGTALALTLVDLYLHRLTSLYTFFYAAFVIGAGRFLYLHLRSLWREGIAGYLRDRFWSRPGRRAYALVGALGLSMVLIYKGIIYPAIPPVELTFRLVPVAPGHSGIADAPLGSLLSEVDPRVQHVAKWLLSAGDAIAAGDFDNDGLLDLFVTNLLNDSSQRNILYRNRGDLRFERVEVPALEPIRRDPGKYGLVSAVLFVDVDNDGDQDLFLSMGYGRSRLLRNLLVETGSATFADVTDEVGIDEHTVSIAANFLDFDRDGKLDLFIANALNPRLENYQPPRPLNIFRLPKPEYAGDRRMFPFMHSSWDNARNGGLNVLYRNLGSGFKKMDVKALGMPETHWSLSVGTGDVNNDGWTDLYVANDFGPDDLYLNRRGKGFKRVHGRLFGAMGRDTYKGMNSSLGDVDRNGYLDIYVSNVHVPLQAEGSLLWMTYPSKNTFVPEFRDEAWKRGALNEHRFGWGAAMGDLNNDGWLDIVQTNGMVDDTLDRRHPDCPSYWYVNEKLMRSGPEIHTYVDMWGDLRGYCINGRESNRIYLSRAGKSKLQFVDVAPQLGWRETSPARGALLADLDNDGDLDVAITHLAAPLALYRNTLYAKETAPRGGAKPHWIGFKLEGNGRSCNRDAAGTQVRLHYTEDGKPARQLREVQIANAFAAQGDRRAHFGLAGFAGPVTAEISWCGAPAKTYSGLAVDRYHSIKQEP